MKEEKDLSIKELARLSGKSLVTVYRHCRMLGRKVTLEELKNVKTGRPPKY